MKLFVEKLFSQLKATIWDESLFEFLRGQQFHNNRTLSFLQKNHEISIFA